MTSDAQILINETASEVGSYRENSSNNSPTGHFLRCNSNICVLPTKKRFSFMFRRKRCIILKSTHLFCSLAFLTKYVYSFVNFWWLRYHSIHKYFSFHNELSFLIAFNFPQLVLCFYLATESARPLSGTAVNVKAANTPAQKQKTKQTILSFELEGCFLGKNKLMKKKKFANAAIAFVIVLKANDKCQFLVYLLRHCLVRPRISFIFSF